MIVVDAHVHFHSCFQIQDFFSSGMRNLQQHVTSFDGAADQLNYALLFTESFGTDFFSELKNKSGDTIELLNSSNSVAYTAKLQPTLESESLVLKPEDASAPSLFLIAGRQIVSKENLEVLTIGTTDSAMEGEPLQAILERNQKAGFLSILPWGFGKWLSVRGQLIENVIANHDPQTVFFGDNGNRVPFNGEPKLLKSAKEKGFKLLSGSDPLPLKTEANKVGKLATCLKSDANWDIEKPFESILTALKSPTTQATTVGSFETVPAFIKNQFYMQYHKRMRKASKA